MLKRFVKGIIFSIISFSILLGLMSATVMFRPQIIVNKTTLSWLAGKYLEEFQLDWDKVQIEHGYHSFLSREVRIDGRDVCFSYLTYKACLKVFTLGIDLDIFSERWISISGLTVRDEFIDLKMVKSESNVGKINFSETAGAARRFILKIVSHLPQKIDVALDNIKLYDSEGVYSSNFIWMDEEVLFKLVHGKNKIIAKYKEKEAKSLFEGEIEGQWSGAVFKSESRIKVEENVTLNFKFKSNLMRLGKTEPQNLVKSIFGNVEIIANKNNTTIELYKVKLFPQKGLKSVNFNKCLVKVNTKDLEVPLNLVCDPIVLIGELPQLESSVNLERRVFKVFYKLIGEIESQIDFSKEKRNIGTFHVAGKTLNESNIYFRNKVNFSTILGKNGWRIVLTDFSWKVMVENYEKFVKELEGNKLAIPAPFNSLKGTVSFFSKELLKKMNGDLQIPFELNVDLDESKYNKLKLRTKAELRYSLDKKSPPVLKGQVFLEKAHVFLPSVDPLKKMPNFVEDKRINKEIVDPQKEQDAPLLVDVDITTTSEGAIRIYYYLFKPFLELNLEGSLGKSLSFKIKKSQSKLKISYLKREVQVNKLKIEKSSKSEELPIDLELLYRTSGYDLFLNVEGTTKSPRLVLNSTPQLPRDDIISLLIFNRKSDDISSIQKESVGGTQAAIADRTLGLFSIWAFASTPIESVSYNPSTQRYSAQVALPGKINLSIGTNWEEVNELSFRKHLTSSWVLVTSYVTDSGTNERSSVLLKREINF